MTNSQHQEEDVEHQDVRRAIDQFTTNLKTSINDAIRTEAKHVLKEELRQSSH